MSIDLEPCNLILPFYFTSLLMKYFLSQFFHENVYFWLSFHTSKLSFSLKSVIVMTWDCHVKMDWTQHSANTQHNLSFIPSAQISVWEHQFWGKMNMHQCYILHKYGVRGVQVSNRDCSHLRKCPPSSSCCHTQGFIPNLDMIWPDHWQVERKLMDDVSCTQHSPPQPGSIQYNLNDLLHTQCK